MSHIKETMHDIDFTFVVPGVGGLDMPMDPELSYDEKLELAYDEIRQMHPDYEDVTILKIEDTGIGED